MVVNAVPVVAVVAWYVTAAGIAAFGIGSLIRGRRSLGASLAAAGFLMIGATVGAHVAFANVHKSETIRVYGLNPTDPPLMVDLPHVMATRDDHAYSFWGAGDKDDVLAAFEAQYPDGVPTDTGSGIDDVYQSLWHVSTDNMRYELIADVNPDSYAVVAQVGSVGSADGATYVRIPWPATHFGSPIASEVTMLDSDWKFDDWRDFYADIGEARIEGDTITVPTDTGGTVTLTIDGQSATFAINP